MFRRAAVAAMVGTCAFPGGAQAFGDYAQLGETGGVPARPAAAADGTLHSAWVVTRADRRSSIVYCRLPSGTTACAPRLELGWPSESPHMVRNPVYVLPYGQTILIAFSNGERLFYARSADAGQSFGPFKAIGHSFTGVVAPGPGYAISSVEPRADDGFEYQRIDGEGTRGVELRRSDGKRNGIVNNLDMALEGASRPVFVFSGDGDSRTKDADSFPLHAMRWSGNGDVFDASTWSPTISAGAPGVFPSVATGPAGTYVAYLASPIADSGYEGREFRRNMGSLYVRKLDAAFGPPVAVAKEDVGVSGGLASFFDIVTDLENYWGNVAQDASGRLHLAWVSTVSVTPRPRRGAFGPVGASWTRHELKYASSSDGANWTTKVLGCSSNDEDWVLPATAVAPDGRAWVTAEVRRAPDAGTRMITERRVYATGPTAPSVKCKEDVRTKRVGAARLRLETGPGGARPAGCTTAATHEYVGVRARGGGAKVKSVRLRVGSRNVEKLSKLAGFEGMVQLAKGLPAGSTRPLRAKVTLVVGGKRKRVTLSKPLKVCERPY